MRPLPVAGDLCYDIVGIGDGYPPVTGGDVGCIFPCDSFGLQCGIDGICDLPAAESGVQQYGLDHFVVFDHGCLGSAGTDVYSYLIHAISSLKRARDDPPALFISYYSLSYNISINAASRVSICPLSVVE